MKRKTLIKAFFIHHSVCVLRVKPVVTCQTACFRVLFTNRKLYMALQYVFLLNLKLVFLTFQSIFLSFFRSWALKQRLRESKRASNQDKVRPYITNTFTCQPLMLSLLFHLLITYLWLVEYIFLRFGHRTEPAAGESAGAQIAEACSSSSGYYMHDFWTRLSRFSNSNNEKAATEKTGVCWTWSCRFTVFWSTHVCSLQQVDGLMALYGSSFATMWWELYSRAN